MKDHFVDKSYDIIVIKFETINFYRRVKDQNDGSWHHTEIFHGDQIPVSIQQAQCGDICDRLDKEYMAWLEDGASE